MAKGMIRLFRSSLGGSLPGFAAQGFTLASALFPIVIGREDVLVYLLTITAPVAILVQAAILGAPTRLPMAAESARFRRLTTSFSGILGFLAIGLAVFDYLSMTNADKGLRLTVLGILVLLPCQAFYQLMLALATAELNYGKLMQARFFYGVVTFIGTVAVGLASAAPVAFLAVAAMGYLCGAIPILRGRLSRRLLRQLLFSALTLRGFVGEALESRYVVASSIVSGLGSQLGALVTPIVPEHLVGAWAAVIRVTSGLQTVGGHILGPKLDIAVLEGSRSREPKRLHGAWRKGLVLGSVLSLVCVAASTLAVSWLDTIARDQWMPLAFAVAGYAATSVFLAPIDRSLTLLGGQRERLCWDVGRALAGVAVVWWLPVEWLLVALGSVGVLSLTSYLALMRRRMGLSQVVSSTVPGLSDVGESIRTS